MTLSLAIFVALMCSLVVVFVWAVRAPSIDISDDDA